MRDRRVARAGQISFLAPLLLGFVIAINLCGSVSDRPRGLSGGDRRFSVVAGSAEKKGDEAVLHSLEHEELQPNSPRAYCGLGRKRQPTGSSLFVQMDRRQKMEGLCSTTLNFGWFFPFPSIEHKQHLPLFEGTESFSVIDPRVFKHIQTRLTNIFASET